ncbi:MAG TPA: AraC family ligand binding domain-containing protein, partial [Bacillota bacterium]|nr:AraC family ligand binding domain-containing protein [Bacillota bacterium]
MNAINEHNHSSVVPYENIIMPNVELPINFIEHNYGSEGPFCILHWHNEIEMVYVKEGTISVAYGSRTVKVEPGGLVFINSNEPHGYSVEKAPIVLYCCTFDPILLQGRYATSYDSKFIEPDKSVTVFNNLITDDSKLIDLFLSMWDEGCERAQGYEYAIKSNLFAIMAHMVRHHIHHTIDNRKHHKINRNLSNINKVIQYMEKNYKKDISLDELADYSSFN